MNRWTVNGVTVEGPIFPNCPAHPVHTAQLRSGERYCLRCAYRAPPDAVRAFPRFIVDFDSNVCGINDAPRS